MPPAALNKEESPKQRLSNPDNVMNGARPSEPILTNTVSDPQTLLENA